MAPTKIGKRCVHSISTEYIFIPTNAAILLIKTVNIIKITIWSTELCYYGL